MRDDGGGVVAAWEFLVTSLAAWVDSGQFDYRPLLVRVARRENEVETIAGSRIREQSGRVAVTDRPIAMVDQKTFVGCEGGPGVEEIAK